MGRYFGKVGYAISVERMTDDDPPRHTGIYEDQIVERQYYGEVIKFTSKWNRAEYLNDDLKINTSISILADEFAYQNCSRIKYVELMGVKWKVDSITPERPRLTLTLGGEYNGEEPEA